MRTFSVAIDFFHALVMVAWIAGLPLLFTSRFPRVTRWFAVYAVAFVVLSQGSQLLLDECFLTTVARFFHVRGRETIDPEWFTVRAARFVFGMAPSRKAVSIAFDVLVAITALGVLYRTTRAASARSTHVAHG